MLGRLWIVAIIAAIAYFLQQSSYVREFDPHSISQKDGGSFLKLRDGRILEFYECGTSTSEDVVLFLHGGFQTGRAWKQMLERTKISKNGVRLITISLPGFGKSSYHFNRTFHDFVQDIDELFKHLKVQKFHIYAASFGAPHAMALAVLMGNRVQNIILSEPVSGRNLQYLVEATPRFNLVEKIFAYLQESKITSGGLNSVMHRILFSESVVLNFFSNSLPKEYPSFVANPYHMDIVLDMVRSREFCSIAFEQTSRLCGDDERRAWDFDLSKLDTTNRKIFLFYNKDDTIIPFENSKWYESKINGIISKEVEGGHLLHAMPFPHDLDVKLPNLFK